MKALKTFRILLLCLTLVFILAACGSSGSSSSDETKRPRTTKESKTDEKTTAANDTAAETPGVTDASGEQQTKPGQQVETVPAVPVETKTNPADDQGIDEAALAFHTYNGYAWLTKDGIDSCYNEAGKLQFSLSQGTRAASIFYNGYAAVMQEGERGIAYVSGIVDTKGNIVFDAEKLSVDGFIFGIYENQPVPTDFDTYYREKSLNNFGDFYELLPVEDGFLEDGYIFAYKLSESFDGVNFEVGVVDMKGNWTVPLAKDNIATLQKRYSPGAILRGLTYCKEGIWMLAHSSYGDLDLGSTLVNYYFYNLAENTWAQLVGNKINTYRDTFGLTFTDGTAIAVGGSTDEMSYIRPPHAGEKTFEPVNKKLKNEYFYNYDREGHVIFATNGHDIIGYDENLNELFRTNYHNVYPFSESSHGYLPVTITNEKGTKYWSLIDRNGEFLFEPQEGYIASVNDFYMDDDYLFFLRHDRYGDYSALAYDTAGNKLRYFEEYKYSNILYHNGVIRTVEKGSNVVEYEKLK